MNVRVIAACFLALLIISCKGEKSTEPTSESKVVSDGFFRVSFDLIVKEDDNMHLFYSVDGSENFNEEQSIWLPVAGSTDVQKVEFVLPEEVIPSLVRVDFGFGVNANQSPVDIKGFKMSYAGNEFKASGVDIFQYFVPFEPYTKVEPNSTVLHRVKSDQNGGPILYPLNAMKPKIEELVK